MKKEKRIFFLIIPVLIAFLIVGILIFKSSHSKHSEEENEMFDPYVKVLENGTKLNQSEKLSQTKLLDGMEISEIQLTYQNGRMILLATVTNTTDQAIELTPVKITLYDEIGNVLEEIKGLIAPIKPGKNVQLNVGISEDAVNAYDFKIEKR